jgi:hypothetical protein
MTVDFGTGVAEGLWEGFMRADHVEVSWDADKSNWMVRITSGEEVIRRHCKLPKDGDEQSLCTSGVGYCTKMVQTLTETLTEVP